MTKLNDGKKNMKKKKKEPQVVEIHIYIHQAPAGTPLVIGPTQPTPYPSMPPQPYVTWSGGN